MNTQNNLRNYLREIFSYEFESGCYGVETSEYTGEIIDYEVYRLSRHRKPIDTNKVYVFKKGTEKTRLYWYDSLEEAISTIKKGFADLYIISDGKVMVPSITDKEIEFCSIGEDGTHVKIEI